MRIEGRGIVPYTNHNDRRTLQEEISTIKKVLVVALIVLVVVAPVLAVAAAPIASGMCQSGNCLADGGNPAPLEGGMAEVPYTNDMFHLEEPLSLEQTLEQYVMALPEALPRRQKTNVKVFPKYVEGFVHNGIWMLSGKMHFAACDLGKKTSELRTCERNVAYVAKHVMENGMFEEVFTTHAKQEKGFEILADDQNIRLGIDPQKRTNQKSAIEFIEDKVLSRPRLNILNTIKKIHKILGKDLSGPLGPVKGGKYREVPMVVNSYDKDVDKLYEIILKKEGKKAADIWEASRAKLPQLGNDIHMLSVEEQRLWNVVFYIPPPPEEIPARMKEFAQSFRELVSKETHPIPLAAWVHMELVRIHPYEELNGRLARMMLHTVLLRGGYTPPIFRSDAEYTQAIIDDGENPGAFASYLVDCMTWTESQSPVPLD